MVGRNFEQLGEKFRKLLEATRMYPATYQRIALVFTSKSACFKTSSALILFKMNSASLATRTI